MATFTDEDLEKLRRLGNEENAKVWLGLHDSKGMKLERKSEDEVRQYLIQVGIDHTPLHPLSYHYVLYIKKYDQRRWYVSPDDLTEQKKLLDEYSGNRRSESNASPSILSHQSNQSAPPNLHSTVNAGGNDVIFHRIIAFTIGK